MKANDSEIRRGSYPGPFTTFIENCSKDKTFVKLSPMSGDRADRYERFEFVLRFFAYLNEYEKFGHDVNEFLNDYLIRNLVTFDQEKFQLEFDRMVQFVQKTFPFGFAKTENAKSTPRVRFEALAVGVALALREKPDLSVTNIYGQNMRLTKSMVLQLNALLMKVAYSELSRTLYQEVPLCYHVMRWG